MSEVVSVVANTWVKYLLALHNNPLRTKAFTACFLNTLEEIIAQILALRAAKVKGPIWKHLDYAKIAKMAAYGLLVNGPLGHVLFSALAASLKNVTGVGGTIAQLLISNGLILPLQNLVYLLALGAIKGLDLQANIKAVLQRMWPLTLACWQYFPMIQLVVYRLFPAPLWPLVFNLIGLLFGVYINYTSSRRPRVQ
eukprot:m.230342 g.230342  ORF g.230342 m.230342 type:complete len:196 (+) comp12047_c0_seq1:3302-3889(+)